MQKTKRLVPQLRFPVFQDEWENSEFRNIAKRRKDRFNPKDSNENQPCIELECLSQETGFLLGTLNSKDQKSIKNVFVKNDILFGKLRPYLKKFYKADFDGVCSSEIWVLNGVKLENEFLYYLIQTDKFNYEVNQTSGSKMPRADWNYISEIKFSFPSIREQQKIAEFLTAIETRIQSLTKKKSLLEEYKRGVLQQILRQEIRFKHDNGVAFPKWEKRKFSDVLFEHKLKSTGNEEVHSVSVHKGVINQIEHLGRSFSAKNTDHYSRALPNDIIYTKSPTGDFPLGIIKQNHIKEDVIISPLYGVFTPETKELGYILHVYFESPINTSNYLSSIIQKGAKNTINITNTTFLSKKMLLPVSKEEQAKIANFLSAIDKKIELVDKQIEKTKTYKKGLLQQMFV
ncbi:restriction endonuclease subunit S [Aequorivita lipolytica]|uniref:restriction endonuclease subunit S n=1 Tax=Aequorivita lipolytica TaxID=153267 RepID=UPI000DBC2E4B|nr:restriction endonuclease subunit S [Aequorivita lipolytica]SRX49611.1 hypothetical protein AEQU2_00074 [Aequorivita lipolytica]